MDIFDYDKLRLALKAYVNEDNLTFADLEKKSGVSASNIGRIASGSVRKTTPETWIKLHQADPLRIPPPIWTSAQQFRMPLEPNQEPFERGPLRKVPVFHAGAGNECWWDDGGYPVGHSDEYVQVPYSQSDEHSFAVKVHGNSMAPAIEDGDVALVVPSRPLQHGKACFVSNQHEQLGERLIRRYFKYGEVVVLKPDNPAEGFEIQITKENDDTYRIFRVTKVEKNNP